MFRVLGDFYPSGATPQLNTQTVYVPGTPPAPVRLERDYTIKSAENMRVSLETIPAEPVAGNRATALQVFPRPTVDRTWVQFQRDGVVNTVHFDIPVHALE